MYTISIIKYTLNLKEISNLKVMSIEAKAFKKKEEKRIKPIKQLYRAESFHHPMTLQPKSGLGLLL
jgi:hypothetical protein